MAVWPNIKPDGVTAGQIEGQVVTTDNAGAITLDPTGNGSHIVVLGKWAKPPATPTSNDYFYRNNPNYKNIDYALNWTATETPEPPANAVRIQNGIPYYLNPDKAFDMGTVADVTARDLLSPPNDASHVLVTSTGTQHLYTTSWADTASADIPVVVGDASVDPSSGNGSLTADWVRSTQKDNDAINVRHYGAAGDGVTDDTLLIQECLDSFSSIYIPAGIYLCSSPLLFKEHQTIYGDGSKASIILNDTTDGMQRVASGVQDLWTRIGGIGFKKTVATGTTTALNLTNTTYLQVSDIHVDNFYCAYLIRRDDVGFGATNAQWYCRFTNVSAENIAYGIWLDYISAGSGASCNGNNFTGITLRNGNPYAWSAGQAVITAGIRYHGYSNTFMDAYIKGFSHHIWRDDKGGQNVFDTVYLESDVVPGEMIYAPVISATYFNNVDYLDNVMNEDNALYRHDPFSIFEGKFQVKVNGVEGSDEQKRLAGYFSTGVNRCRNGEFETDTDGWEALSGAVITSETGGVTGNCMQIQQPTTSIVYSSHEFPVIPGVIYEVVFSHKSPSDGSGRLLLGTSQTGGQYETWPSISTASWTEYKVRFTATEVYAYLTFAARAGAAGSIQLYDAVSIKALSGMFEGDIHVTGTISGKTSSYPEWSTVPSTDFDAADAFKKFTTSNGITYYLNPDKAVDLGPTANPGERNLLTPLNGASYTLVASTGTYQRWNGITWIDTGSAVAPVVPGDASIDPSSGGGTSVDDWVEAHPSTKLYDAAKASAGHYIPNSKVYGDSSGLLYKLNPNKAVDLGTVANGTIRNTITPVNTNSYVYTTSLSRYDIWDGSSWIAYGTLKPVIYGDQAVLPDSEANKEGGAHSDWILQDVRVEWLRGGGYQSLTKADGSISDALKSDVESKRIKEGDYQGANSYFPASSYADNKEHGANRFVVVPRGTGVDGDGVHFDVGDSQIKLIFENGIYKATQFGAIDSMADASTFLLNITENIAPGKVIVFDDFQYKISQLKFFTGTTAKCANGGNFKCLDGVATDAATNYYLLHNLGESNVTYERIVADGNAANNTLYNVFDIITAVGDNTRVKNCELNNAVDSAVMISSGLGQEATSNDIVNFRDAGIYCNTGDSHTATASLNIESNHIHHEGSGATQGDAGISNKRISQHAIIADNNITGHIHAGLTLTKADSTEAFGKLGNATYSGNNIDTVGGLGIAIHQGENVSVSGGTVKMLKSATATNAYLIDIAGSKGVSVSGLSLESDYDVSPGSPVDGVVVRDRGGDISKDISVTGCSIRKCRRARNVLLTTSGNISTHISFAGNLAADCQTNLYVDSGLTGAKIISNGNYSESPNSINSADAIIFGTDFSATNEFNSSVRMLQGLQFYGDGVGTIPTVDKQLVKTYSADIGTVSGTTHFKNFTTTIPEAEIGDHVGVIPASAAILDGVIYDAHITATDTCTLRAHNTTDTDVVVGNSHVFKFIVTKYT